MDAYRQPKQIYWLWQANRTGRLMVHARDYWWRPSQIGTHRDIVVDSNGETVELYVGEEFLGERHPGPDNFFSVVFKGVFVRKADLRVIARRGSETASHVTRMSGPPAALCMSASRPAFVADRAGIVLITVDVVDACGIPVIGARPPVRWDIKGPGMLVAPAGIASDIDRREAMDGSMYTIMPMVMPVRSGCQPGKITIEVSAPGLCPAWIVVESLAPAPRPDDGIYEIPAVDGGSERLFRQRRDAGDKGGLVISLRSIRFFGGMRKSLIIPCPDLSPDRCRSPQSSSRSSSRSLSDLIPVCLLQIFRSLSTKIETMIKIDDDRDEDMRLAFPFSQTSFGPGASRKMQCETSSALVSCPL